MIPDTSDLSLHLLCSVTKMHGSGRPWVIFEFTVTELLHFTASASYREQLTMNLEIASKLMGPCLSKTAGKKFPKKEKKQKKKRKKNKNEKKKQRTMHTQWGARANALRRSTSMNSSQPECMSHCSYSSGTCP